MGPVQKEHTREQVVARLVAMLHQAHAMGAELVVYPELALTTFFPRWFVDDISEADHYYERTMPSAATQLLFDEAKRLGVGFCLGYAHIALSAGSRAEVISTWLSGLVNQGDRIVASDLFRLFADQIDLLGADARRGDPQHPGSGAPNSRLQGHLASDDRDTQARE